MFGYLQAGIWKKSIAIFEISALEFFNMKSFMQK